MAKTKTLALTNTKYLFKCGRTFINQKVHDIEVIMLYFLSKIIILKSYVIGQSVEQKEI